MTDDYGTIRSPNFPRVYSPSTEICWIISVQIEKVCVKSNIFEWTYTSYSYERVSNLENELNIYTYCILATICDEWFLSH